MIGTQRWRRFAWAATAASFAQPAVAHHSAALFDTSTKIEVEGVVTKYDWRNPHIYMTLRVAGANGVEHDQEIEAGASSVLLPLGLTPTAVAVGERVTIRGNPSKRGAGTVLGRELVKADGSVLPLNITSAATRKAPTDVVATSIAGTWFPPLRGFGGFGPGPGHWSLTERGRAALAAFDVRRTAHADCIPVTAPTLMLYPVTSVVEVTPDVVKLHVDWMSSERVVYLDDRGHPPNGAPSLHGHSIGHWEGTTLVVDTVQFTEHKQGNAMNLPSGLRKHVVERFSLSDDRKHLRYESVLEDPDYLAAPVTYSAQWDYRPDLTPTGIACDLDVARRFLSEE
jgi:Family of unknown function (DUF6152)